MTVLTATLCVHGQAAVRRAADDSLRLQGDAMRDHLLDGIPGAPPNITNQRDAYVFIWSSGAGANLLVLADKAVEPARVARVLEQAARGRPFAGRTVQWDMRAPYSVASVEVRRGQFGKLSSRMELPIGDIIAGIREGGFRPRTFLLVRNHASATPRLGKIVYESKRSRYYDVSDWQPGRSVVIRSRIPASTLSVFLGPMLLTGGVCLAGLGLAVFWDRRTHSSPTVRRLRFRLLTYGVLFVAVNLQMFAEVRSLILLKDSPIRDIWFGGESARTLAWALLTLPWLWIPFVVILFMRVGRRLFRDLDEQAAEHDLLNGTLWYMVPMVAWPMFMSLFLHPLKPVLQRLSPPLLGLLSLLTAAGFAWFMQVVQDRLLRSRPAPEELVERARSLASRLRVVTKGVRLVSGVLMSDAPNGFVLLTNRVFVTDKAAELLSDREMDFLLAHEIAHMGMRHVRLRLTLAVPVLASAIYGTVSSRLLMGLIPLALFVILLVNTPWICRRQEYEADATALRLTGDLEAAQSCLKKLAEHSGNPEAAESEFGEDHPKLSKRLAALEEVAKDLGSVANYGR